MARQILVVPYNPQWREMYEKEKNELCRIFGAKILDIQHFGSTSIPGLAAKPTIDIMITTEKITDIDELNDTMAQHNYTPRGENGMEGRRYFVKTAPDQPEVHLYHVHIYEPDNPHVEAQLLFRDYLLSHPEAIIAYQRLKIELAKKYRDSPCIYTDGKTEFVNSIIERARQEMRN